MSQRRFLMLEGVFTPCLLSILGVIMYLRLGWVVGHAGLWGAITIIALANFITIATALSMSSIVTNIRIGAGGAYSIITKSLGIEAGGAIGIPLYISQATSVAFYIIGFAEGWSYLFPQHSLLAVSLVLWLLLTIITYVSAKLAFRIQYVVMAIIFMSLISVFFGPSMTWPEVPAAYVPPPENFWKVFAIFFPAVTGILAGASMSGELKDPKSSIPKGTLWAVGVSLIVYVVLTVNFANRVPSEVLKTNNYVIVELGRWPMFVIAGIMGATLSSALAMFVGSPRILTALGKNSLVPFSASISKVNPKGEPTVAILLTSVFVLITLLNGSLNQIAGLLTMFFLITYGMINAVVFIEQTIGIVSFRPSFKVNRIIPLLGSLGCLCVMFLINVKFSVIAIVTIFITYYILIKREVTTYSPDIRSGMLIFLAEQFSKAAARLPYYPKIWKPNVIVPVYNIGAFKTSAPLLSAIINPAGRLTVVAISNVKQSREFLNEGLEESLAPLKDKGLFVESTAIDVNDISSGVLSVVQTLRGLAFPPNTIFYTLSDNEGNDDQASNLLKEAGKEGLGIIALKYNEKIGFSQEKIINLWVRQQSPNINLSILIALQLQRNWEGKVRILQIVSSEEEKKEGLIYLKKLKDLMRMPSDVEMEVYVGSFETVLSEAPPADINIFGMPEVPNLENIRNVAKTVKTSILFLRDSKHESATA